MGFLGRIFGIQERQKQPLGNVVITFYDDNEKASITSTAVMPKEEWLCLYVMHLADTLYYLGDQDVLGASAAATFIEQMTAYATGVLIKSASGYAYVLEENSMGKDFPEPLAGEVEIVPEAPGGYRFNFEVIRIDGVPRMKAHVPLRFSPGQLVLGNLVFLHYIFSNVFSASASQEEGDEREKKVKGVYHKFQTVLTIAGLMQYYREHPGAYRHLSSCVDGPMYALETLQKEPIKTGLDSLRGFIDGLLGRQTG